jgi:hypothetical protein
VDRGGATDRYLPLVLPQCADGSRPPLSNGKTQTPLCDALRYVRRATAGMRKYRSFRAGFANGSNRPIRALQDRPHERAGSARERTLAEDVGCARGPAVCLRIILLQFAYLLGLRCAPAKVRPELHDLADRFRRLLAPRVICVTAPT